MKPEILLNKVDPTMVPGFWAVPVLPTAMSPLCNCASAPHLAKSAYLAAGDGQLVVTADPWGGEGKRGFFAASSCPTVM